MSIADFETLCETTYEPVANATFLIVGDRHEALDITQEAFSRALERWEKVSGMSNPQGWVFRVAVNLALSRRRAVRRLVRGVPEQPVPQADAPDPALAEGLNRLSPAQRAAIVSRFYLDLSVEDSARVLGKRPGAVRTAAHRGLRRLAERLAQPPADCRPIPDTLRKR